MADSGLAHDVEEQAEREPACVSGAWLPPEQVSAAGREFTPERSLPLEMKRLDLGTEEFALVPAPSAGSHVLRLRSPSPGAQHSGTVISTPSQWPWGTCPSLWLSGFYLFFNCGKIFLTQNLSY